MFTRTKRVRDGGPGAQRSRSVRARGGGKPPCIGRGDIACPRGNPSIDNASGLSQWFGGHRYMLWLPTCNPTCVL